MTLAIIWPPTNPAAAQALLESAGELPGRHRACASGCVQRAQISTRELRTAAGLGPELPDLVLPKEALGAALNTAPGVPLSVLVHGAAWSTSPSTANLSMPTTRPQHRGQAGAAWGRAAWGCAARGCCAATRGSQLQGHAAPHGLTALRGKDRAHGSAPSVPSVPSTAHAGRELAGEPGGEGSLRDKLRVCERRSRDSQKKSC